MIRKQQDFKIIQRDKSGLDKKFNYNGCYKLHNKKKNCNTLTKKTIKSLVWVLSPLKHYNIIKQIPLVSYTKNQDLMGGCLDAQKSTQTPPVTLLSISNSLKRDKLITCASSIHWNKTEICIENSYWEFKSIKDIADRSHCLSLYFCCFWIYCKILFPELGSYVLQMLYS